MIFYFYKFAAPVNRIINFIKTQYDYLIFIKSRSPVFFQFFTTHSIFNSYAIKQLQGYGNY